MRSSPKENQSLEVKVKGISEMEFSLSIFDYTFTNYREAGSSSICTKISNRRFKCSTAYYRKG
ncbi:MAG: hypothetical protein EWV49_11755 [Microcystis aeruginosa Ma_QC_Ch_20071001_S25]|uniref:Uncharacterized protein n=1 Tax=Microcystis aeruginosa Ma_QC_Ch_20071001_S25D TaxID=2486250 RepID=A0A552FVL5_MICAE|nr:MAG: hypothetical protein EWV49_11755 [Microcystis aeruginosa Ma_QC_Ch_20071001_S25]TRU50758.1 MAG: hypothetical protein EWV57_09645 [Microcystis aeruginosa Ma_QC_Ch_20071001_S25D]TRU67415.1 MAG: hypothetical protein EWV90_00545 [Microcystis aeruginosa Ma_QC_Ch_20071001_M135]